MVITIFTQIPFKIQQIKFIPSNMYIEPWADQESLGQAEGTIQLQELIYDIRALHIMY